ncbi:MAG: RNHCP domain-containing protein [Candidatus Peregrinibacteria bacterium]
MINEEFECKNCGHKNPKLKGSCRNHCQKCLFSLHMDKDTPGDRLSHCRGLMEPVSASKNGKKGWMISHRCVKCGKTIPNTSAEDDDFNQIIKLTLSPNEQAGSKKTGK